MKRHIWLGAAMTAALVRPAMADDLTITSKTTNAVTTANAANGSAGNITIASGGSIEVSAANNAMTLNSNNAIVNNGLILNTTGNTSSGVNILAGTTGSLLNNGNITVAPTGNTTAGSAGILLSGTGAFTGNITLGRTSYISASQTNAEGIALHSDLIGNLTTDGTILATGVSANGVTAISSMTGRFANFGNISVASNGTSTTTLNPSPGATVSLGGSVGGGILNAGPVNSSDTTAVASINQPGIAPAFIIAPSVGGNVGSLNVGVLSDANNPGYSIINRGRISSVGTQQSVSTIGLQIGNNAGDTTYFTNLAGGVYNSGSISASATSDNKNATALTRAASNASAVRIGSSAVVPVFDNAAGGAITATTSGPLGGTATAMQLYTNASMPVLNNAGLISASANSDPGLNLLTALGIVDSSGSLLAINNTGTISATATVLNNNAQVTTAIDLSTSPRSVTVTNSGTIVGDIKFGSSSGNQLLIEGPNATVTGEVQTTSPGRVGIAISQAGTGGVLTTHGGTNASSLTVGANGTLNLGVSGTSGISATGPVSFDATSRLTVTPISLLPQDSSITLLHSDTSLSFGNYNATTTGFSVPFLFTGNLSLDSRNLTLNLHRKSSSELGLTGDSATIYEPAMAAAATDNNWGAELSKLSSSAAVQSTIGQLAPITSNATVAVAKRAVDTTANPTAMRQKALVLLPSGAIGVGFWASGLYDRYNDTSASGYTGNGKGFAVGVDYAPMNKGHAGIAFSIYKADTTNTGGRIASEQSQWVLLQPYMGLRNQNFFINGQMEIGFGSLHTARTVQAGSVTREANGSVRQLLASGGITSGYITNLGPLRFVPEINFSGLQFLQDGYTETNGGGGVNLSIKERSLFSVRGTVGATIDADFEVFGGHVVPQIFGGWSQEIISPDNVINASFASVATSNFSLTGPREARSRFIGSAGLFYVLGSWSVGVSYDATYQSLARVQGGRVTISGRF